MGALSLWPTPIIEYRSDLRTAMRSRVVAHEIAHTFFCDVPRRAIAAANEQLEYSAEEWLCDKAVPLLLLPSNAFAELLAEMAPSSEALKQLADRAQVTRKVLLDRLLDSRFRWPMGRIYWKFVDQTQQTFALARYSVHGGMKFSELFTGKRLESADLHRTYSEGRETEFCRGRFRFQNSLWSANGERRVVSTVTYASRSTDN